MDDFEQDKELEKAWHQEEVMKRIMIGLCAISLVALALACIVVTFG